MNKLSLHKYKTLSVFGISPLAGSNQQMDYSSVLGSDE